MAIGLSVHSVKGKAALLAKRELAVHYTTAFVLLHKLREALAAEREHMTLGGTVEMDAMFLGGHVKPENVKAERVDRRLAENQSGKRMAVMAMRERTLSSRTVAAAVPGEQVDVAWHLVKTSVRQSCPPSRSALDPVRIWGFSGLCSCGICCIMARFRRRSNMGARSRMLVRRCRLP